MSAFLKGTLAEYEEPILPAMSTFCDFDAFGVMPRAGGIRDQEPDVLDDLRFCVNLKREHEHAEHEAAKRKQQES